MESKTVLDNPIGLDGIEFIEYASPDPAALEQLFFKMGFQKIGQHKRKAVTLYRQNHVNFIINSEPGTFAAKFAKQHGPSICATGFRVKSAQRALDQVVQRGGRPIEIKADQASHSFPAIYGIGDSAIYFVDRYRAPVHFDDDFRYLQPERFPKGRGLTTIDHLTNNVPKGELDKWVDFYTKLFNFHEVRHFDIKGKKTGLTSKAMRSPCRKITIPINEPTEGKSQIQEYLDEYRGSGIQHLAFGTGDIIGSVKGLVDAGIKFLDAPPDTYYEAVPGRVPNVTEDMQVIKDLSVLVDGDDSGYLLQIFTQNLIGPIFFEIIQRRGHDGFGDGNFQALFEAIERDQQRRGYL
ncbi:MAG: 4-hydroxyphenylpyruvate dioxygenase [Bdellovibrionales bacterium]|nr:4-hydroxyphenylpyruvate dioxygenase [Bdellovibrionales bacterium]